uniref:LAGLIDADG endonuclease n=1 Tax=Ramaria rubella TaxID=113071 RepID=UPI002238FECA
QIWPLNFYFMQQTISENVIPNLLDTLSVSCLCCTSKVKVLLNMKNSQVTKAFNSLVETSEAIRLSNLNINLNHNINKNIKWSGAEGSAQRSSPATLTLFLGLLMCLPAERGAGLPHCGAGMPHCGAGMLRTEGCFYISVRKVSYYLDWRVEPKFKIRLSVRDLNLENSIKDYFRVGNVAIKKDDYVPVRRVRSTPHTGEEFFITSLKDLNNVIIPHFLEYPLITQKKADFLLFKQVVDFIVKGEHLNKKGIEKILSLKASINLGLSFSVTASFPFIIPALRDRIEIPKIINPHWMVGLTSGEGSFHISILNSKTHKIVNSLTLDLSIAQNIRDIELLKSFINFFNCGCAEGSAPSAVRSTPQPVCSASEGRDSRIKQNDKTKVGHWKTVVTRSDDISDKIIPFFKLYPIQGVKSVRKDKLVKNKNHFSSWITGLEKIKQLKSQMNKNRKFLVLNSITSNKPESVLFQGKPAIPLEKCDTAGSFTSLGVATQPKENPVPEEENKLLWVSAEHVSCGVLRTAEPSKEATVRGVKNNLYKDHSRFAHLVTKNSGLNSYFTEWLAGLIDGDGSFLLSKKGYASLEITMDIRDEHALQIVKNVYGGSIKLRSGANALRYRLHHKSGLLKIINDVNEHIRNPNRQLQLNKICYKYELTFKFPNKLTYEDGWLSGFFDADGTVTINKTNTQLSISASQKTSELLQPLVELYGGNIYIDRGSSKSFKWYISKREEILKLIEYFKVHPSRSAKKQRLFLIPKYYELKDLKAHKANSDTNLYKSWQYFYNKWLKYEDLND